MVYLIKMLTAHIIYSHIIELLKYNELKMVQKEVVIPPCYLSEPSNYTAGVLHLAARLVSHSHSEGRKEGSYFITLTWYYANSCNGGTKSDNELEWRIPFLCNLDFKGTHIILEEYPWYTMRALVMVNGTLMILHWILVSSESTQKCVNLCWDNVHKILVQHSIYKLQTPVL